VLILRNRRQDYPGLWGPGTKWLPLHGLAITGLVPPVRTRTDTRLAKVWWSFPVFVAADAAVIVPPGAHAHQGTSTVLRLSSHDFGAVGSWWI